MANRQRGCTAEETQLRSRRKAEGTEMRELKRQTGGADERSNAVGSRRNAPAAERRSAGLSGRWRAAVSRRQLAAPAPLLYNKPRTSTFPDRRRIFPLLPTPFASMAQLIARTPLTVARYSYSLRTIFPAVIPRSCSFCAQLQHAAFTLIYKGRKRANE